MDDYDVFLNHCGPDVKAGFVAHLEAALRRAGLNPFLDKGNHAFSGIDKALQVARVHVAVVSRMYAESKYCLTELVDMLRSGKPVIPIFYDVEPMELRRVDTGVFAAAFEKHRSREAKKRVQEWADALCKLADINAFVFRLSDHKGNEVELIREVLDVMLSSVSTHDALQVAKKDASEKIETLARFSVNLEGLLKQVIICPAQCKHLVQMCSTRIQKIKEIHSLVSDAQMLWLYDSGKLRQLYSSLDNLLNGALMSTQKLLEDCGGKEWRRVALVLSLPPPDQLKYSGSKFALLIRELGWSLDIIQYTLHLPEAPHASNSSEQMQSTIQAGVVGEEISSLDTTRLPNLISKDGPEDLVFAWSEERCRYVLQRNLLGSSGIAIDELESLLEDNIREALDHNDLLIFLENSSIFALDNFCSPLAWRRLWYNLPCGTSYKFAAAVKNRCQDISGSGSPISLSKCFEINYLDLKLQKCISSGGFKRIFKGEWLGQEVAIAKIYSTPRDAVEREAGFMVTIHHPNVVDFFGCTFMIEENDSIDENQPDSWTAFLVMELMEEDLCKLIKRLKRSTRSPLGGPLGGSPFSLPVTVDILIQIVEAMIHSHKHNVMHRDLKTSNCLVSRKPAPKSDALSADVHYTVKLIDFGISKLWDSHCDVHTQRQGTARYMAPEVWGGCEYTCSADVYSFGMVCYEVITGDPPFSSLESGREIYKLACEKKRPQIPEICPQSLNNLMTKCWAHKPTDRPTFEAVRKDLWDIKLFLELQIQAHRKPIGPPRRGNGPLSRCIPAHNTLVPRTSGKSANRVKVRLGIWIMGSSWQELPVWFTIDFPLWQLWFFVWFWEFLRTYLLVCLLLNFLTC